MISHRAGPAKTGARLSETAIRITRRQERRLARTQQKMVQSPLRKLISPDKAKYYITRNFRVREGISAADTGRGFLLLGPLVTM